MRRLGRAPKKDFDAPSERVGQPQVPRGHGAWRVERAVAGFRRSSDRADQAPARSRRLRGKPPVSQAELQAAVDEYRRLREEHRHAHPLSRARRRLDVRLRDLHTHFERLLAEAPIDELERGQWRLRLLSHTDAEPHADVRPLLFGGRSESGSELRLTWGPGGTIDAAVDGVAVAVLDDAKELTSTEPGFGFELDGVRFREIYDVSPASLGDLREAVRTGRRPQRKHLRTLIENGLVDRTLNLTARGRRALGLDVLPARHLDPAPLPAISVRGPVPVRARAKLARSLAHVAAGAPRPVLAIAASLTRHEDLALSRPVTAKATLDVSGRRIHAHATAASESEAVNLLESRLRRNLRALAERELTSRRREHDGRR